MEGRSMTVEQFEGSRGLPAEIKALEEARKTFTIAKYIKVIDEILAQRVLQMVEVEQIIKQIGDPIQQRVIYSYIRGKRTTFDAIACAENYCLRTISRVYRAGIDDLVNKGLLTDTENTQENAL